jgi:hypothetical protein
MCLGVRMGEVKEWQRPMQMRLKTHNQERLNGLPSLLSLFSDIMDTIMQSGSI